MPFVKKDGRTIFINDFGTKNSKDIKLLGKGMKVSEIEAISKLDDKLLKEVLHDNEHLTKEEMFVAKNRPDLIKSSELKKKKLVGF